VSEIAGFHDLVIWLTAVS